MSGRGHGGRRRHPIGSNDATSTSCCRTQTWDPDYAPDDVGAAAAMLGKPVGVAALAERDWHGALAGAGFSQGALAGFTEMTRGLNSGNIGFGSDPGVASRAGTALLERVIADLVQRRR